MIKDIQNTGMVCENELEVLKKLELELEHTFNSVQVHRTRTEMEISVLNDLKHPTPASKYWQALREQNAMLQGVTLLSFDYRMEKVRIKVLMGKYEVEPDELKREMIGIKIEKKEYQIKSMEQVAKNKIREIKEWSEIKKREAVNMSEEELADVDNHQLISYTRRWINQVIEMGNTGSPSERHNLIGQLNSAVDKCREKGVLPKVLEVYGSDVRKLCEVNHG